jgi:hypothetical protein
MKDQETIRQFKDYLAQNDPELLGIFEEDIRIEKTITGDWELLEPNGKQEFNPGHVQKLYEHFIAFRKSTKFTSS